MLRIEKAAALSARLALSKAGIEILTSDDAEGIGRWLRENGIIAALVRPDRYVRATARNGTEFDQLLAAVVPSTHLPSAA